MKLIELRNGMKTQVDDDDFESLSLFRWSYKHGYAIRTSGRKAIYMHNEILKPPPGLFCDHINRDKLDNCRSNLRVCERYQNAGNAEKYNFGRVPTSQYKGVHFERQSKRWVAEIYKKNVRHRLGRFRSEDDAARAYNLAAAEYWADFAYLNSVPDKD